MNLAQALAIAAAAFVVAIGPTQTAGFVASASAHVADALDRGQIRASVAELADLMEANYVFPDAARQYAEHLRSRAAGGAYDQLSDPAQLAATLESELRAVHPDAHLRVSLAAPTPQDGPMRRPMDRPAVSDDQWLADEVAYFRINALPGDDTSVRLMAETLDRYVDAQTLIIDLRACPGGTLPVMDELFSRLYAAPTRVMILDTRTEAVAPAREDVSRHLHRASAPAGVTRDEHWTQPTTPVSPLSDARVFVLTGRTGSACEHLAQALRETGRATLVGATTGGAGHYGGMRRFGEGRFAIFLPVGNSYAPGAQSWEGVGVQPHRNVPAEDALNEVLREIGVPVSAAAGITMPEPPRRVVEGAPPNRRYGVMMAAPEGGESFIAIDDTVEGSIARTAGVRPGDRIVRINGRAVSDLPPQEIGAAMRGSPITLEIERGDERVTIEMSLGG
jgi:C-terminal processing protease CtpA/Prc